MQTWLQINMPPNIKENVASVKKNTEGDYYFIGYPQNAPDGAIVLDPYIEINKALSFLGNAEWWNKYCTHPMFVSEMLRLAWALQYSDLLYADADCEFFSPPIIQEKDTPHLPWLANGYEFFLFYSGNTKWWEDFRDYSIKNNSKTPFPFVYTMRFTDMLNWIKGDVVKFPLFYRHYENHRSR